MATFDETREPLGEVHFPREVQEALKAVSEVPEDLEEQADFFDKIQNSLASRMREEA